MSSPNLENYNILPSCFMSGFVAVISNMPICPCRSWMNKCRSAMDGKERLPGQETKCCKEQDVRERQDATGTTRFRFAIDTKYHHQSYQVHRL